MGSVCSCFNVNDVEDYLNPNNHVYRNCTCVSCFVQYFFTVVCLQILEILCFCPLAISYFFYSLSDSVLCFVHGLNLMSCSIVFLVLLNICFFFIVLLLRTMQCKQILKVEFVCGNYCLFLFNIFKNVLVIHRCLNQSKHYKCFN